MCNKICNQMLKYAQICILYAKLYAEICKNKDSFSKNMQKYAENMQKYAGVYALICTKCKYAKNMQKHMQKHKSLCFAYSAYICTLHFADASIVDSSWEPRNPTPFFLRSLWL